jgi:hypothetical protein
MGSKDRRRKGGGFVCLLTCGTGKRVSAFDVSFPLLDKTWRLARLFKGIQYIKCGNILSENTSEGK